VYPGCDAPSTSYTRTVYVDGTNGSDTTGDGSSAKPWKTLNTAIKTKLVQAGDHVVVSGTQPGLDINKYSRPDLINASSWIWLDFQSGSTISTIAVGDVSHWLITGATVTAAPPVTLVSFVSTNNVVLADSSLYTALNSSGWSADTWINHTDNGINTDSAICVALLRNSLKNVRFGITVFTRAASPTPSVNSIKALVKDNLIKNFSADGIRPLASDVIVSHNGIYDEYAGAADGDDNHDDGMQGFALPAPTTVYANLVIDHNWIQETTNPSRALNAELQGISVFDGIYTNVSIHDNVILTSAYHGIGWFGATNSTIDHNTVINPTTNGHKLWISVMVGKLSSEVASGDTVSNNVAEYFPLDAGVASINNSAVDGIDPTTLFVTFDPAHNNFDLRPKPGGPLDGKNQGADLTQPIALAAPTHTSAIADASTASAATQLAAVAGAHPSFLVWIERVLAAIWNAITSFFK
jgi:hypothetical protein